MGTTKVFQVTSGIFDAFIRLLKTSKWFFKWRPPLKSDLRNIVEIKFLPFLTRIIQKRSGERRWEDAYSVALEKSNKSIT